MTNWGWNLPPGVSQRDLDGPEDERRACGCGQDCDCLGPNLDPDTKEPVVAASLVAMPGESPILAIRGGDSKPREFPATCEGLQAALDYAGEGGGTIKGAGPEKTVIRPTTKDKAFAWLDFQAQYVRPELIQWGELATKFGHSMLWAEGIYKEWRRLRA